MLHGSGMLGSKMPASKPHLYSCYIILQCSWLECAKAAWPNLQPVSQTQCLHSACCLFPGQHKEWLGLSSRTLPPTPAHGPLGSAGCL